MILRSSDIEEAAALKVELLKEEPAEEAWASDQDASQTPPWGGVPGMSVWEESLGQTQVTPERSGISDGLGSWWKWSSRGAPATWTLTSRAASVILHHSQQQVNNQHVHALPLKPLGPHSAPVRRDEGLKTNRLSVNDKNAEIMMMLSL